MGSLQLQLIISIPQAVGRQLGTWLFGKFHFALPYAKSLVNKFEFQDQTPHNSYAGGASITA
jgi:hypothetical protein